MRFLFILLTAQYSYDPSTRLVETDNGGMFWTIVQWVFIAIVVYFTLNKSGKKNK